MTKSGRFAGFSGQISRQSEPYSGLFLRGESRVMDRIHGFLLLFSGLQERVSYSVIYPDHHSVRGIPDSRKFFFKKTCMSLISIAPTR
jgi:hypothetical protein